MPPHTVIAATVVLAIVVPHDLGAQTPGEADAAMMGEQLQAFLDGQLAPEALAIRYSDYNALMGGLTMTVYGTGKVEQRAVRRKVPQAMKLDAQGVRKLVKLLLEKEAWKKAKIPPKPALPGEVFATLTISAGDVKSSISERARDMKAHDRILPIMLLMQKLAWPTDEGN